MTGPLRIPHVRRGFATSSAYKRGLMYWSRHNKRMVHFSWDPDAGVKSTRIDFALEEDQARALRDWLLAEFPLSDIESHDLG